MKWHEIPHEKSISDIGQVVLSSPQVRTRLLRNPPDSECLQGQTHCRNSFGQVVPVHNHHHHWKGFSLFLSGISCISMCALCLLCCPCESLRKALTYFLFSPHQVVIYVGKITLGFLFYSPALSVYDKSCFKLFTIFVALCWSVSRGSMSLVVGSAELSTAFQKQPHQCWVQVKDHVLSLAAVVFLMHSGWPWSLLFFFFFSPDPSWHFLKRCIPFSQSVLEPEVIPPLGQDLVLLFDELIAATVSLFLQLVGVPPACRTLIWSVSPSSHICVIYRSNDK